MIIFQDRPPKPGPAYLMNERQLVGEDHSERGRGGEGEMEADDWPW